MFAGYFFYIIRVRACFWNFGANLFSHTHFLTAVPNDFANIAKSRKYLSPRTFCESSSPSSSSWFCPKTFIACVNGQFRPHLLQFLFLCVTLHSRKRPRRRRQLNFPAAKQLKKKRKIVKLLPLRWLLSFFFILKFCSPQSKWITIS